MILGQAWSSAFVLGNGRDLGGLSTRRGQFVRRGRLLRSAAPDFRDPAVRDAVAGLGLTQVFDFRMRHESPGDLWRETFPLLRVWRPSKPQARGDPHALLAECLADGADPQAIMIRTYRSLPVILREHLRAIVRALPHCGGPVLFHCAAGKDRTGAAAAILLALAGVSRDEIYADYLRSNEHEGLLVARYLSDGRNDGARATPYRRWRPLMRAEPSYLDALFDEIERGANGVEAFARERLALTNDDIAAFRAALLD